MAEGRGNDEWWSQDDEDKSFGAKDPSESSGNDGPQDGCVDQQETRAAIKHLLVAFCFYKKKI